MVGLAELTPLLCRAGRVGTAYSLLTRDELPYLLDLHLFLARPLRPAPVQSIAAAAGAMQDADPETSVYGSFPLVSLESAGEHVRELVAHSTDLQSQLRYANNAFKLYRKTRPAASPESIRRAKGLPAEGIHPVLASSVPSTAFGGRCNRPQSTTYGDHCVNAQWGLFSTTCRFCIVHRVMDVHP